MELEKLKGHKLNFARILIQSLAKLVQIPREFGSAYFKSISPHTETVGLL